MFPINTFYILLLSVYLSANICHTQIFTSIDSSASGEQKHSAFSFHLVNDNYIATWLPGEDGHYFGADDFLTGSFLLNYYRSSWQHSLIFNAVTLRHKNLRYDLLSLISLNEFYKNKLLILSGGAGIILKGKMGGEQFQNGYHQFRAIKRVKIPYSGDKGLGLVFALRTTWRQENMLFTNDNLQILVGLKVYSDYAASHLSPEISYRLYFWDKVLQTELLIAYRGYLNKVKEYSSIVNSGIIYGINAKVNVYKAFFFDIGFITIPTQNVESDPIYPKYKNNYLPQVWIGFSWQTSGFGISDFLHY